MAKQFTHEDSLNSVMSAIEAVTSGKSEAEYLQLAAQAVSTVKNSNSMVLAQAIDQDIALQNALDAAENQANEAVPVISAPAITEVLALPDGDNNPDADDNDEPKDPIPF